MTAILQILTSPRPASHSRRMAGEVVARIAARHPGASIVTRDLASENPPHPDVDLYDAILSPTPDDDPRFALSETYIRELEAADFVVIGTPVNNFSVPSTLKAWIDHIVRIRRTFQSTREGKIGQLRDRPVIIVTAHGGFVTIPPVQPDHLTDYVRVIFETIGIPSVEFLRLEGMSRGPEAVARALDAADSWMVQRLPQLIG
ncbi:MAG TPA: NAD(P)H-dependent oxidoreductase [Stellaceae bacterium]|jgi:FMN-dependent NADH-azoreductase